MLDTMQTPAESWSLPPEVYSLGEADRGYKEEVVSPFYRLGRGGGGGGNQGTMGLRNLPKQHLVGLEN